MKLNKNCDKPDCHSGGFTLLEIIIVIAIMVVISTISVRSYFNIREKQAIQKDADSVVATIEKAKSLSSNRKNDSSYGVKIASSTVTVFSGSTYANGNVILKYDLEESVKISTTSLSSHGTEISFDKITGTPSATGTITLSNASYSKIVTIYGTGIIEAK